MPRVHEPLAEATTEFILIVLVKVKQSEREKLCKNQNNAKKDVVYFYLCTTDHYSLDDDKDDKES